jgi:hypothetical protein
VSADCEACAADRVCARSFYKYRDLPVQFATKYELTINPKIAKALAVEPPISLLARTDELIE